MPEMLTRVARLTTLQSLTLDLKSDVPAQEVRAVDAALAALTRLTHLSLSGDRTWSVAHLAIFRVRWGTPALPACLPLMACRDPGALSGLLRT